MVKKSIVLSNYLPITWISCDKHPQFYIKQLSSPSQFDNRSSQQKNMPQLTNGYILIKRTPKIHVSCDSIEAGSRSIKKSLSVMWLKKRAVTGPFKKESLLFWHKANPFPYRSKGVLLWRHICLLLCTERMHCDFWYTSVWLKTMKQCVKDEISVKIRANLIILQQIY